MKFKYTLDRSKHSIDVNKYEQPTGTLIAAFTNPVGGANPYVWFGYEPQRIFYHIQRQLLVSIINYIINASKQVNN